MSNLGFEPRWVSSTTRNLTSWAKPTAGLGLCLVELNVTSSSESYWSWIKGSPVHTAPACTGSGSVKKIKGHLLSHPVHIVD
jgi:hypothetical protein